MYRWELVQAGIAGIGCGTKNAAAWAIRSD
jgi:hypothetical protein